MGSLFSGGCIAMNSQINPNRNESDNPQNPLTSLIQTIQMRNPSTEIPAELHGEIEKMRGVNLAVSRWDIDSVNKKFIVYTYTMTDPATAQDIDGIRTGNWTVELVYDTEFVTRMNKAIEESNKIRKLPEMKISAVQWSIDGYRNPPVYEAIVYVTDSTPENQKLNGTDLYGWKISVYRSASYPPLK